MKKPHAPAIRELLRKHLSGMTAKDIQKMLPIIDRATTVKKSLLTMPDAYVDRWVLNPGARGQYEAVWCLVVPPEHCPYPTDRYFKPQTCWVPVTPHTGRKKHPAMG